jgi:FlaA1/EpsC-like NDP-sugar epimerase
MRDIDIVFHTAAMKHVSICEQNPIDAVRTNVLGTQNLIELSLELEIDKFINISTDKATNPIGVMGATKLLTEKLVHSAYYYKSKRDSVLTSIRFGNVMGSSGSVLSIFERQIKSGEPISITDPDMTRYFMSNKDAINLILEATLIAKGQEVFIFKMPQIKITDLAEVMNERFNGHSNIETIGIIDGEKMEECLISANEINMAYENKDFIVVCPKNLVEYYTSLGFSKMDLYPRRFLNKEDIMLLLDKYYESKD